ncbi:hypothetical protein BX666DRAFT_344983 [Dichotomocladium elegans]|nr:hypothetical protein BX666DRAFT_344983 [Dichotomocladium elegans]
MDPTLFCIDDNGDHTAQLTSIGSRMLLDYNLVIGDKRFDMLEVEGYLRSPNHPDPFTHGHPLQKKSGYWFFHRAGMSNTLRNGSRKGVDITIGNKKIDSAGGMLIRAVQEHGTGRVIDGPCLLVNEIMATLKHSSLATVEWDCWTPANKLYLEKKVVSLDEKVHRSCRVGLTIGPQEYETRLRYISRPYRFCIRPDLLPKGRLWTVFGMLQDGIPHKQIVALTGLHMRTINKLKTAYETGCRCLHKTLHTCIFKSKGIKTGSSEWKMTVMSAVNQWNINLALGEVIDISREIEKKPRERNTKAMEKWLPKKGALFVP